MKAKKRNPQDATLRNIRALKKTITAQRANIKYLWLQYWKLNERVKKLERKRK